MEKKKEVFCDSCIHTNVCAYKKSLIKINTELEDIFTDKRQTANVSDEILWFPGVYCSLYAKI